MYNSNYYKKIDYSTIKSLTNTRIVERYIIMQSTNVNIIRQSGKVVFSVIIKPCEWYDELDESVKIDTEINLKRHIFRHFHASRLLLEKNTVCSGNCILTDRHLHARSRQPVKI